MQYAVAFRYFAFYLMHLLMEIYLFDRFFLVHHPDVFIISLSGQRVRDKEYIFLIMLGEFCSPSIKYIMWPPMRVAIRWLAAGRGIQE